MPVMPELPVNEPLDTRIDEPAGSLDELGTASGAEDVIGVVTRHPTCLAAWARLGEIRLLQGRAVDAYACFRVGYHRGLDRIRKAGWRGSGRVPWAHEGNRGFLRSLRGLGEAADLMGEADEAERCATFLRDLAPDALDD